MFRPKHGRFPTFKHSFGVNSNRRQMVALKFAQVPYPPKTNMSHPSRHFWVDDFPNFPFGGICFLVPWSVEPTRYNWSYNVYNPTYRGPITPFLTIGSGLSPPCRSYEICSFYQRHGHGGSRPQSLHKDHGKAPWLCPPRYFKGGQDRKKNAVKKGVGGL